MPEYLGVPFTRSFQVDLPLERCAEILQQQNEQSSVYYNSQQFNIVVTTTQLEAHLVEFKIHAARSIPALFSKFTDVYGHIQLHGLCQKEGAGVLINYDFWHPLAVPTWYKILPDTLKTFWRALNHDLRQTLMNYVISAILICGVGVILLSILLKTAIFIVCALFWVISILLMLKPFSIFYGLIHPVILLDKLMVDIFGRYSSDIGKKKIEDS